MNPSGTGLDSVIVLAKQPVPGRVKTRLVPPLDHDQAARLAAAALADTLRAVDAVPARARLLAFDGDVTGWLPAGWRHVAQPSGGLDVRIVAAFAAAGTGPAVLVGMDTPQLCADQLARWDPAQHDACLGPATDGGYWAVGFADPRRAADAVLGVPMSTDGTGVEQRRRLEALGLRVLLLDELTDVDTIDSARAVAAGIDGASRFAAAFADLTVPAGM